MLTALRYIPACIFILLTVMPGLSLAAKDHSLAKAIKTYKSGYNACVEAHRIRSSNLVEAKDKISFYLKKLEEAKSIDQRIMSTTEQNVDRNITQCKTAEEDILRSEAFPIIEKAFNACNKAKKHFSSGAISSAERSFKKYTSFKSQAFAITTSLDKQPGTKAKIKRCDKSSAKFKLALVEVQSIVKAAELKDEMARQSLTVCSNGKSKLKTKPVNKQAINAAKSKLSESLTISNGINFNIEQAKTSSKYGVLPIHNTVLASLAETKKCQQSLKSSINKNNKVISDRLLAKSAAAKKAQEQKLLKEKAAEDLANKQRAEKLMLENKLADKKKQDALIAEQENKQKEALAKAEAIKKQKADELALKKVAKETQNTKNVAAKKKSSADWRNLVEEKAPTNNKSKSDTKQPSTKKDWTNLAPVNKN